MDQFLTLFVQHRFDSPDFLLTGQKIILLVSLGQKLISFLNALYLDLHNNSYLVTIWGTVDESMLCKLSFAER